MSPPTMLRRWFWVITVAGLQPLTLAIAQDADATGELRATAVGAMRRAAGYYRTQVASHGGYVYHYLPDLSRRWGEGEATRDQIWVQPPGTPTVGLAFLDAYHATGDRWYLEAARDAALALVAGQLQSGGWTNCIDFDPRGERIARYRRGGKGKNNSSLDDGQTQSALLLLIRVDKSLDFSDARIHESVEYGLQRLLAAQFPCGAFPQVWDGDANPRPEPRAANYPDYDWRTEGKIKEYWNLYTLNDNVCGYLTETLIEARRTYDRDDCLRALERLAEFLAAAQMPDPQPAWAQQYNYQMQPAWARKFEPAAIASDESQEAIATLLRLARFLERPELVDGVPRALRYLESSRLPDGQLARFYELRTNRPLYMRRDRGRYLLTFDDSDLPGHYGWKIASRLARLSKEYEALAAGRAWPESRGRPSLRRVKSVVETLDSQGRWIDRFTTERKVGQLKLPPGAPFLSSATFSRNLTLLARFVSETGSNSQDSD